jgi:hypothetical protein
VTDLPPLAGEDHVCAACGLAYADLAVAEAPARLEVLVRDFEAAVVAAPDPAVRPQPSVWSPAEYACHVRDVLVTYTVRLHRARREDRPVLEPMYNDLRARRFDYAHADLAAVRAESRAAAAGLTAEIARITDADRLVSRLPGEHRSTRWLVRQTLHEVRHHTLDIRSQ